jgi:hypothetical protein
LAASLRGLGHSHDLVGNEPLRAGDRHFLTTPVTPPTLLRLPAICVEERPAAGGRTATGPLFADRSGYAS